MKLWKFMVAAVLMAPLAGCVSKAQLRDANQALELENFHLEQRLNDICWKLEDAQRDLDSCRASGAIPIYNGGPLAPLAPATPTNRDPRRPAEADDIDKPPKIELPDDEPNMPSAGRRKERAPRYSGPPVISPPDPNIPEGILPHSVSSRAAEEGSGGAAEYPPEGMPRAEPDPVPESRPVQSPNWRPPNAAAPVDAAPQAEPEYAQPQESPAPNREPESVSAPMPADMPSQAFKRSPEPAPVPESVDAPAPGQGPAPAPVGLGAQSPDPETVAAPPGRLDTELRDQPDSRPLVEPEPIAAPLPSATARATSTPPLRPARARGNTQAGNAALSMFAVNPRLTIWRQSAVGSSPDDGLIVVMEPRTATGEMVEVDGDVAIIVLDPNLEGPQAKVARWDFTADKVAERFKGTQPEGGFHFPLEWPGPRPQTNRLDLYVRLTLPDQRQFVAEYTLEPNSLPPPSGNAPTPAPEPEQAPSEPPPGPPASAPVDGAVSRTSAWTSVDSRGASPTPPKAAVAKRPNDTSSEWRRAVTPLPVAPQPFGDSDRPASAAPGASNNSRPSPSAGGSAWSPYR